MAIHDLTDLEITHVMGRPIPQPRLEIFDTRGLLVTHHCDRPCVRVRVNFPDTQKRQDSLIRAQLKVCRRLDRDSHCQMMSSVNIVKHDERFVVVAR